jgi:tetratricopeptide (TPR) repeat protein
MNSEPLHHRLHSSSLDTQEDYQALVRALRRKKGFGLFFVQCSRDIGNQLTKRLPKDIPQKRFQHLLLEEPVETLYNCIDNLRQHESFDILLIQGLEHSLYAYEDTKRLAGWSNKELYAYSWKGVPQILSHLNRQRERFRDNFDFCIAFLIPRFVVDYFIQRAPDFFDWRSGLFKLDDRPETSKQRTQQLVDREYDKYQNLSSQERLEKILEIKDLLEHDHLSSEGQAKLLREQGRLFNVNEDYANALVCFDKAITIKADYHYAWNNRGNALSALGRHQEAIESYERAIAIKADKHKAWYNLWLALSALGRKEEEIESYERAIAIKADKHKAWNGRGNALSALGRHQEAIESYERAIAIKANYHYAWNGHGNALSALGRHQEAIESYERAIAIKNDKHQAWNNRGNALSALGRHQEAIESYERAIAIKNDYHKAWYNRGVALYALGSKRKAIASYEQAVKIKPDYYRAWNNRGDLLLDFKRYQDAIENYNKSIAINPEYHFSWKNLGVALMRVTQYEKAIESFNQAINLKANYASAFYDQARCYALWGKIDDAIDSLQKAIELYTDYREDAKTDQDFNSIRDEARFKALIEN